MFVTKNKSKVWILVVRDVIKLSVSIFGQTEVYRIYTVSREPMRLPEIQYPVIGI